MRVYYQSETETRLRVEPLGSYDVLVPFGASPIEYGDDGLPIDWIGPQEEKVTAKTQNTIFEVLWYNGGPEHAPNRVIGRDFISRHDLTGAITWACNHLKLNTSAHGFYVHKLTPQSPGYDIYVDRTGKTIEA